MYLAVPEVNVDAYRYFTQAKHLELYGIEYFFREWGRGIPAWIDLPLMPFLYGLIFKLCGESRIWIQLFNTALFASTAVVTSLLGKTLWDEDTGFFGGMFLLGMPFLLIQTPLMLVDVGTMFFLTVSIYLFLVAIQRGGRLRVMSSSVAVFLTVFCKYSTWLMLFLLPLAVILSLLEKNRSDGRAVIRRSMAIFLLSGLFVAAAVAAKFDVVSEQLRLLLNYQRSAMTRESESLVGTLLFQISPVITIAAAASVFVAFRKRDLKHLILLWLPLLVVIFRINRIRYILPVFPMFALMASYGISAIRNTEMKKSLIACTAGVAFVVCFFGYMPYLKQTSFVNLLDAGDFLNSIDIDTVEAYPLPQKKYPFNPAVTVPVFDLYTQKEVFSHDDPSASTSVIDYHLSPYRDTWEYRKPEYYLARPNVPFGRTAVVIIKARENEIIPPLLKERIHGLTRSKMFVSSVPVFFDQIFVDVYW